MCTLFYATNTYLGIQVFCYTSQLSIFIATVRLQYLKKWRLTGMCVIVFVLTCQKLSEQNIKAANLNINNIPFKFILKNFPVSIAGNLIWWHVITYKHRRAFLYPNSLSTKLHKPTSVVPQAMIVVWFLALKWHTLPIPVSLSLGTFLNSLLRQSGAEMEY